MRKLIYTAFLAAVVLSLGCAITNYPVITDSAGPVGGQVMNSFYDKAYVIPSSQVATIWADGTDELFTLVTQDWKADQRLFTYNNFDSTGIVSFLDQTYCDPTRQTNCALATAWNPDLPDNYPHGSEGGSTGNSGDPNQVDNPFDFDADDSCSGYRSLSLLLSVGSRIGECGSSIDDFQGAAAMFAGLDVTTFQGRTVYHAPINASTIAVDANGVNVPVVGQHNVYFDEYMRAAVQTNAATRYQISAFERVIGQLGTSALDINVVYDTLEANYRVEAQMPFFDAH